MSGGDRGDRVGLGGAGWRTGRSRAVGSRLNLSPYPLPFTAGGWAFSFCGLWRHAGSQVRAGSRRQPLRVRSAGHLGLPGPIKSDSGGLNIGRRRIGAAPKVFGGRGLGEGRAQVRGDGSSSSSLAGLVTHMATNRRVLKFVAAAPSRSSEKFTATKCRSAGNGETFCRDMEANSPLDYSFAMRYRPDGAKAEN